MERLKVNEERKPFVSVIIPVRDDIDRLAVCLKALEEQNYPADAFEVMVVDNGAHSGIQRMVEGFSHAVLVREEKEGSYAARNKGIAVSSGEVLAFTDSDCIPAYDWIEKGVQVLLGTEVCGMIGGRIDIFFKDPEKPTAVEICDSVLHLQQRTYIEKRRYGATANIFVPKKIFNKVGMFDDRFRSSGDREWGERVFSAGYRQIYSELAVVAHPARRTIPELCGKIDRIIEGEYARVVKTGARGDKNSVFRRTSLFLGECRAIFFDNRLKGLGSRATAVFALAAVACTRVKKRVRIKVFGDR